MRAIVPQNTPVARWVLPAVVGLLLLGSGCRTVGQERLQADRVLIALPPAADLPPLDQLEEALARDVERTRVDSAALISPRLLDLYMARAMPDDADLTLLWAAYRTLLRRASLYPDDISRVRLQQHLALTELLTGAAPHRSATEESRAQAALEWWLDQETAPALGLNERLNLHLARVAEARTRYASWTRETGLDERGETLVRYGAPTRTRSVRFDEGNLLRSFMQEGLPVRQRDFPENEVWMYDEFGQVGLFLFARDERTAAYRLVGVNDLLPRQLRSRGLTASDRNSGYAVAALRSLRFIFSQLALFHPSFSARFNQISEYVDRADERAFAARVTGNRGVLAQEASEAPRLLESSLTRNHAEDGAFAAQRERTLPATTAPMDPAYAFLPDARAVRFRTASGSTEVLLLWSEALASEQAACHLAAEEVEASHRIRWITEEERAVIVDTSFAGGRGATGSLPLPLDRALRLGVQVDRQERTALGEGGVFRVCSGSRWLPPLEPLPRHEAAISDLLPFAVDDVVLMRERLAEGFSRDAIRPVAFSTLAGQQAIGVYFEVYPPPDRQAEYLITYETIATRRGGILRGERRSASLFQSRRVVRDDYLPAAFLIDAAQWADAESIEVVLTVTDLDDEHVMQRSITFPMSAGRP